MNEPLVTVRTLVYNTGKYVIEGFESLLDQNYRNIEHIIIDDCSTDNSVEVIEAWIRKNNHPCLFIKHKTNVGLVKSLNEINQLATGKYITGLMDDLWRQDRLRTLVNELERLGPQYCTVFSDAKVVNEDGQHLHLSYYKWKGFEYVPEGEIFRSLLKRNYIIAPSNLTRLSCIKETGGYDENLITEDKDMWLKLSLKYKFKFIDQPLLTYRVRKASMTRTKQVEILKTHVLVYKKYVGLAAYQSLILDSIVNTIIRISRYDKNQRVDLIRLLDSVGPYSKLRILRRLLTLNLPSKLIKIIFKV